MYHEKFLHYEGGGFILLYIKINNIFHSQLCMTFHLTIIHFYEHYLSVPEGAIFRKVKVTKNINIFKLRDSEFGDVKEGERELVKQITDRKWIQKGTFLLFFYLSFLFICFFLRSLFTLYIDISLYIKHEKEERGNKN